MNYSTFDINNFFIQKDSTYPILKFPLTQKIMEIYDITGDMLQNVAVTFSMVDAETGLYRIANVAGNLAINDDRPNYPDEEKYTLTYKFTLANTKKSGNYLGSFVLDFLGDSCGKIKFPVNSFINIVISDSITQTTVI